MAKTSRRQAANIGLNAPGLSEASSVPDVTSAAAVDNTGPEIIVQDTTTVASRYSGQIITDEEEVKKIVSYLETEYAREDSIREPKKPKWAKWRAQLDSDPDDKPATTKLENPSRIRPPLAQINGQTMAAKLNSYFAMRDPFWTLTAIRDDTQERDDAKLWTKYVNMLAKSPNDLDLKRVRTEVHNEAAVMPLCFTKVAWSTVRWNFKMMSEGNTQTKESILRDGPEIVSIPIENIVYPSQWRTAQEMPWICYEYDLPPHEVRAKGTRGEWILTDEIIEQSDPEKPEPLHFREFHFFWDVEGDGLAEDLIFTIYPKTSTVVQQMYNEIGIREFEPFRYIAKTGTVEGRGTGQICEAMQDEVEGIHNVRNDNMKIANMRMIAMRRSVLTTNKDSVYPGKIWITDNPREDISPVQLGEVYPSSGQQEQASWQIASQATGLSEVDRGFADPVLGTRDTYRGQMLRLSQAKGIFSSIAEGIEASWSRVGMLIVLLLVRNAKRVIANEKQIQRLSEEELLQLDRMLAIDVAEVPRRFRFSVETTDLDMTYAAIKDSTLALTQIYTTYAQQTIPLAMQLFGPQGVQLKTAAPDAWQFMLQMLVGSTNLMETTARLFKFDDTENYVPDLTKWEIFLELLQQQQQAQINAAGLGGLAREVGGGQRPSIASLQGGAGGDGGGGSPGSGPGSPSGLAGQGAGAMPGAGMGAGGNGAPGAPRGMAPQG
jgi:hypothetical protein